MPFTFKLSKRLARIKASLVPAAALALAMCQPRDGGITDPTPPSQSVMQAVASPDTITLSVASWNFDEGSGSVAADVSGNGNAATLAGGRSWAPGVTKSAVLLDGVSGQLSVPNSASLNPSGAFSLAAWVQPKAAATDFRAVVVKNYTYFLYASVSGHCGNGGVLAGFGSATVCSATPLPVNTWTHLAVTYDGATLSLFTNGVLVASRPASGAVASSTSTLQIGASQFGEFFNGLIDEVRLYHRGLSASDVQALAGPVVTIQPPAPVTHAGYYVAPTGSASGNGSASRPWDLATALAGAAVHPGDTVWLRGGTYSGAFTSYLTGTIAQPIVVRQYPGERATIRGNLTVRGSDTWFWGFEIFNPDPVGSAQLSGVNSRGPRSRYINLVIHDASGNGVGLFDGADLVPAPGGEVYGSIIYNNGKMNFNDHGIYVNNQNGAKTVRDNIIFDNWAIGIQVYATGPTQYLNNITTSGNILFNNGMIGGALSPDILVGGSNAPVVGGVVTENYTCRNDRKETANIGYYFSTSNADLTLTNNYFVGTMEVDDWTTALVSGNVVYSTTPAVVYASGHALTRGNIGGHTYRGNRWYGNAAALQWSYQTAAGPQGTIPQMTHAQWLAAVQARNPVGFANPGAYAGTTPPDSVVVRPNVYEPGRANIAIYNWSGRGTVAVDVSTVLTVGQSYRLMHVFNMYGTPVLTGTYTGGALQVPMTAVAAPAPIGRGVAGPSTGSTFNAYVLLKTP